MRILTIACCLICSVATGSDRVVPPNVIVILVDDLGYGDLSCYGASDVATPHIDQLTERGMRWTQFYANCPVCSPTRAALLSGRYPDAVGVPGVIRTFSRNSWGFLSPEVELLPEVLKRAGYRTAMIGKWHLGLAAPNVPTLRGFDFFHGFLGDMMDDYYHHGRDDCNYMRRNREVISPPKTHATDLFADWAQEWIKSQKVGSPFFLYLAFNAPHSPIQPPEEYLERYHQRHPDVSEKRANFAAFVEHLDAAVGRVTQTLLDTGLSENTLLVFVSDNGGARYHGADNGTLAGQKQDMLEGGIRVPMCAVWPGQIAAGTRSNLAAMTMDLFPTICEAVGTEIASPIDGRTILPTLRGAEQQWEDRELVWVRLEGGERYQGRPYYCIRRGPWKLLQNDADEPMRLYNLSTDLQETSDVVADHPQIAASLQKALEAHIARWGNVPYRDSSGNGPGEK